MNTWNVLEKLGIETGENGNQKNLNSRDHSLKYLEFLQRTEN